MLTRRCQTQTFCAACADPLPPLPCGQNRVSLRFRCQVRWYIDLRREFKTPSEIAFPKAFNKKTFNKTILKGLLPGPFTKPAEAGWSERPALRMYGTLLGTFPSLFCSIYRRCCRPLEPSSQSCPRQARAFQVVVLAFCFDVVANRS